MDKKIFERLDSTNNKAQELISNNEIKDICWVQAYDQILGRGMGKNTWFSEAGMNITGSLVVFPSFLKAEEQFSVSLIASLSICDLLDMYFDEVRIKWPNDILINGSKICGLLVEHAISGRNISHSIIGIGLNVNQRSFPPDIPGPTSFRQELGMEINLDELRDLLLDFLESRIARAEKGNFRMQRKQYLSKLYRYREFAPYRSGDEWFRARIIDIDRHGKLILETETGEISNYGFKEIEFID